jgi:hypothetical protein
MIADLLIVALLVAATWFGVGALALGFKVLFRPWLCGYERDPRDGRWKIRRMPGIAWDTKEGRWVATWDEWI